MTTCTWQGCESQHTVPQVAKDGVVWACLCFQHREELDATLRDGPRAALRAWILAQGGAAAAAKRF